MASRCIKRFKFAFSTDNDDNIRSGTCASLTFVLAIFVLVFIPQIGYGTTLLFSAYCPEDQICACLNMSLSYIERYPSCFFSTAFVVICILLLCLYGIGLVCFWKYELPLLRAEIVSACIPPAPRDGEDEEDDEEVTSLLRRKKRFSLFWLVSLENPNRLFRVPSRSFAYLLGILIVLGVAVSYPISAIIGSKYSQVCERDKGWLCVRDLPCNATQTTDYKVGCALMGYVTIGLAVVSMIFLVQITRLLYGMFATIPTAFKKPEEIDSIKAIKTMERAIV